jgi:hypothetical protein
MLYGGEFIEPFTAAVLGHSCNANTWIFFEGNELRVRSTMDIAAGTVLTVSFLQRYFDYIKERKEILLQNFNVDCDCPLCQKGNALPPEPFRTMIDNLKRDIPEKSLPSRIREIELTVAFTKDNEYGYETPGMGSLYGEAMYCYLENHDLLRSLKSCLVLCYLVLPASINLAHP